VLVEASSGKLLGTPQWPSNSRYALVIAVNDKGMVLEAGTDLTLFSLDLRPVKRITLSPVPADQYGHDNNWVPHSSWSGKRVLLLGGRVWMKGPWLWLEAENLEVLRSWEDVLKLPIAVSDDQLVMGTGARRFGDPPSTLVLSAPGGDWRPIPSTANPSTPQFVGPELLFFHRFDTICTPEGVGAYLTHTDNWEASRLEPPRKSWGFGRAATSRTGKRFTILLGQTKGSHPALDISGHSVLRAIRIFDTPFSASSTLEVRGSRIKNPDTVALSPDGRHLAVLAYPDPVMELFELPPAN